MYRINNEECIRCKLCLSNCPVKAIRKLESLIYEVEKNCILCGKCYRKCPVEAIIRIRK